MYSSAHQQRDKALPNLFKSPCNLAPQECYKQDIEIHINEIKQCNGAITLSIKHPLMPRETIALKHTFGLYLIDQVGKLFSKASCCMILKTGLVKKRNSRQQARFGVGR